MLLNNLLRSHKIIADVKFCACLIEYIEFTRDLCALFL